jgi:hypothetical protein
VNNPWISCWYVCSLPLEESLQVCDHQLAALEAGWCTRGSCCCTVWRQRLYLWSGVVAAGSLGGPPQADLCCRHVLVCRGARASIEQGLNSCAYVWLFAAAVCVPYTLSRGSVCTCRNRCCWSSQVLPWGCTVQTVLSAAVGWAMLLRVCGPLFWCLCPDMGQCGCTCTCAVWSRTWVSATCACILFGPSARRWCACGARGPTCWLRKQEHVCCARRLRVVGQPTYVNALIPKGLAWGLCRDCGKHLGYVMNFDEITFTDPHCQAPTRRPIWIQQPKRLPPTTWELAYTAVARHDDEPRQSHTTHVCRGPSAAQQPPPSCTCLGAHPLLGMPAHGSWGAVVPGSARSTQNDTIQQNLNDCMFAHEGRPRGEERAQQ